MLALNECPAYVYTAPHIRRWLLDWGSLRALAESPNTAAGLAEPGNRPTRETPRLAKQVGTPSDPSRFIPTLADIERAWLVLTPNSWEARIVELLIHGHTQPAIRRCYHWTTAQFGEHLDRATEAMAAALNGESHASQRVIRGLGEMRACRDPGCEVLHRRDSEYCSDACYYREWRRARDACKT